MPGTADVRTAARAVVPLLLWGALLTAALVAGRASRVDGASVSATWPAVGVATTWLLTVHGRRAVAPCVLVGVLTAAVNAATGTDVATALWFAVINVVHPLVAVAVLRRAGWTGPRPLRALRDVTALLAAATGSALASGVGTALLAAVRLDTPFGPTVPLLVARNGISTVIVVAALGGYVATDRDRLDRGTAGPRERLALVALALLSPALLLRLPTEVPLSFLVMPVIVLTAVRVGPVLTAGLVAAQSGFVLLATAAGRGPFGGVADVGDRLLLAQTLLVVVALVGLCLAAAERERAGALHAAATSRDALQAATDAALVGQATLAVEDGRAVVRAANPALCALLGAPADELVGTPWSRLVAPASAAVADRALVEVTTGGRDGWHGELLLQTATGTTWTEAVLAPVDGSRPSVTAQFLDVSARKTAEERLQYLALHDDLTGLANRALWHDRVEVALARGARTGSRVGVLYVDLDSFKAVNDTYGHEVGDRVLVEVGRRLQEAVRPQDTVARIGGDEFVVVCPDLADTTALEALGARLLDVLTPELELGTLALPVRASVGASLSREGETDVRSLLGEADTALYSAKAEGRGRATLFRPDHEADAVRRSRLLVELGRAVERDELVLHYQPVLDLRTGRTVAVEALLRWQHPELGLLPPAAFLDVLEAGPLVHEVGMQVLATALRDVATLPDDVAVSVNVSAEQLARPGVPERVAALLADTGVRPERLVLEVTETRLLAVSGSLLRDLHALRAQGVRLAADDFGTGFSTLTHLVELPVDVLKIDRSFVAAMGSDLRAQAVAAGVVAMAAALGLECVAEGVEQQEQAEQLAALGCSWAQGWLWAPAMPLEELRAWSARVPAPRSPREERERAAR